MSIELFGKYTTPYTHLMGPLSATYDWSAIETLELAAVVVTQHLWDRIIPTPRVSEELPKADVSWRDAFQFCNELSIWEGLTPAHLITTRTVERPAKWRPPSEPAPDVRIIVWDRNGDGYRLPPDAQWQVAWRAGTSGARFASLDEAA